MQACDRPPRALRFVRSTARLRRGAGRQLCLTVAQLRPGQSRTFGVTFRLRANVTAATVTNGGSVDIPAGSAPVPPAAAPAPLPPDAAGTPRRADTWSQRTPQRSGCGAPFHPTSLDDMKRTAAGGLSGSPAARANELA